MLKRKQNLKKKNKGMSLIEILIAIVLIGIIASTFLQIFLYAFDISVQSQEVTDQIYSAQAVIESVRGLNYRQLFDPDVLPPEQDYDSDGDGVTDYYIKTKVEPYGTEIKESPDASVVPSDAVYLHVIYYGFDMMVVGPEGNTEENTIFYEGMTTMSEYTLEIDKSYTLEIDKSSTKCKFTIGTLPENTITFQRDNLYSDVIVIVNLDMKESSYTDEFVIKDKNENASNFVVVKLLGNPNIAGTEERDGTVIFTKSKPDERYLSVLNLSSSLVKVTVDLYENKEDTIPKATISEIIEVSNGEPDPYEG